MTLLAHLPMRDATLVLGRATAEDVPSVVDLLAADPLGVSRDGVTSDEDFNST